LLDDPTKSARIRCGNPLRIPMSDPNQRLRLVRELFDRVMDQPPDARLRYLSEATTEDASLRRDVELLLSGADATNDVLPSPLRASGSPGAFDAPSARVGQRLGAYDIVQLVGLGGMGAVYEAVRADDQYRKRVAIKLVQGGVTSELTLARFRRERQILATLEHRNIATLLDGGLSPDGVPYLVMEYVEGEPITHWCDAQRLTIEARVALFRQVCSAVQHAHRKLVIHRDIKPGNIMVTPDGTVKLLDFGIAQLIGGDGFDDALPLTRGGARPFTPEYASPEQIRDEALTTASDVYSLGVVLFELLTGRRPRLTAGRSFVEIERAVLEEPFPLPSASLAADAASPRSSTTDRIQRQLQGELDKIVLKATRLEPDRRYASVEALSDDLQRHLTGQPVSAERDWVGYRLGKFIQRNRGTAVAAALVIVALVGGVITTTVQARRARAQQLTAEQENAFLRDLLGSVKPSTGGRDVPISEVLDSAAHRLDRELGSEPVARAALEEVISNSYELLGRYDDAIVHRQRELAVLEQLNGHRSPEAVSVLTHIGQVYAVSGDLPHADSTLKAALALHEAMHLKPDTILANIYGNMGNIANQLGDAAGSVRLHEQSLDVYRIVLGPKSTKAAVQLQGIAGGYGNLGKLGAAESTYRRAMAMYEAADPGVGPARASMTANLAVILDQEGKVLAADSMYRTALDMRKALVGDADPTYNLASANYAGFLFDQHRYAESLEWSRGVLTHRGQSLSDNHPAVGIALQVVGKSLDHLGQTEEGGRALEESLALRRKNVAPDTWIIASSEGALAEHYTQVHDFARAERLLLDADRIFQAKLGPTHPKTLTNNARLVALYLAWKKPAKASEYRARQAATPAA
jgi:serine/threonine-protein kinase